MRTIALEFVPPFAEGGTAAALEEAEKVLAISRECGIEGRIRHLMIPGMIEEDSDRPVEMKPRLEPLNAWRAVSNALSPMRGLCTQVTAFLNEAQLTERFRDLVEAGMDGILFVGVPRTMADGEGGGVAPTDALNLFRDLVPNRGVILIPTRSEEYGRFKFKCERGATFAMTQLLYSDRIVEFLKDFAGQTDHRPEILLSFGYVPKVESRVQLIRWLIQDPGNPLVDAEQRFIEQLAEAAFAEKKRTLLDHYKRIIDGVREAGFEPGVHFETPYGFAKPAFEVFAEMLEYWSPDVDA